MKIFFTRLLREMMHADEIDSKLDDIIKKQEEISERMTNIEVRLLETTRALATLALIQSNLLREIGEITENAAKAKNRASVARKPGTDFTN